MTDVVGEQFANAVTARLQTIEERLVVEAAADTPFVTEAANHIIQAGGKRFRPLLVILAASLGEPIDEEALVRAALVVELTHVGSLYHDDVMDDADLRRGAEAAHRRWQNSVAIMVGDYLFSRASSIVATLGTDFVKLQADTFSRLVQGQIAEIRGPQDGDDELEHYLQVVADKTGSLIASSAVFGGMVAGLGREQLDALARFGEAIGVVFQLSDDLIDITSDVTGKTPGTDLREGVSTLPILLARRDGRAANSRLLELISGPIDDEPAVAEALALLRVHPAIPAARDEIAKRAAVARGYLSVLPAGEARDALAALCDQVVTRSA